MNKTEKVAILNTTMMQSNRRDNPEEKYTHFTDTAPRELTDLYLENYEVRDLDYEIFSDACDLVRELYDENKDWSDEAITDAIYDRASDSASVYTAARLAYLNIWNQDEISDTMREYNTDDIATACAIWYDRQIEQAAIIIKDWINA